LDFEPSGAIKLMVSDDELIEVQRRRRHGLETSSPELFNRRERLVMEIPFIEGGAGCSSVVPADVESELGTEHQTLDDLHLCSNVSRNLCGLLAGIPPHFFTNRIVLVRSVYLINPSKSPGLIVFIPYRNIGGRLDKSLHSVSPSQIIRSMRDG